MGCQALREKISSFGEVDMRSQNVQENRAKYCQEIEELRRIYCEETDRARQLKIDELTLYAARTESFCCESALDSDSRHAEQGEFHERRKGIVRS